MLVEVSNADTKAIKNSRKPALSSRQKIMVRMNGRVRLRYEVRDDWVRPLPIYAAMCRLHGYYEDYPHGWRSELECPECLRIRIRADIRRSEPYLAR
jgi:hypothetical protein